MSQHVTPSQIEIIPFDPRHKFVGTYKATEVVLSTMYDVYSVPYEPSAIEDLKTTLLDEIAADHKIDNTDRIEFIAWWTTIIDALPSSSTQGLQTTDLPSDLHPLIHAYFVDGHEILPRHAKVWFGVNGQARRVRSASVAAQEGRARDGMEEREVDEEGNGGGDKEQGSEFGNPRDEDDDDDQGLENNDVDPAAGGGSSRGPLVEEILRSNPHHHSLPLRPDPITRPASAPPSSYAPMARRRLSAQHPPALARQARPTASSFFDHSSTPFAARPLATSHLASSHLTPPLAVAPPRNPIALNFAQRMRENASRLHPSSSTEALPIWVQQYRANNTANLMSSVGEGGKVAFKEGFTFVTSILPINFAQVQQAAFGEYVDLEDIRDYQPDDSLLVDSRITDLFGLGGTEKKKKRRATRDMDYLDWADAFDTLESCLQLLNDGLPFEEERRSVSRKYKDLIARTIRSLEPQHRHWVIEYDIAVRTEVAKATPQTLLRYLGEANHADPLYLRYISTRQSAPLSGRSTNSAGRRKNGTPETICIRFNRGIAHESCDMRHACRKCQKDGHRETECRSGASNGGPSSGGNAQVIGQVRGGAIVGAHRGNAGK